MTKKRKNNASIYGFIASIILAFLTIINLILILKMSVLPFKYLVIILVVFLIAGIIIILNFKSNKKIKKLLHVFTTLFIIVFFLIFIYLNKTTNFLNNIISKNYKTQNYIVVVNKNDNYDKIEDLKNKNISYAETDIYDIKNAINTLKNKIEFRESKFENHENMIKSLYDKKVDAIIIEESYKDLLVNEALIEGSNSLYKNFDEKTKIIYSFELKLENKNETESVKVSDEPFNVYISGIDTYGKISSVSRSDVNIVATINPKTKQILLTTIPRDYYVKLNGKNGYKDKLTHAGIYGIETSEKTIEDLLGIDINYNIKVNFTSLIKMVDAVGGVDVYSEYEFSGEKYSFKKGYNKMNGEQALEFSRTRKTLVGGDRSRGKNQEAVIAALINKMSSKAIITNYVNILDALEDTFVTNMSQKEITELIKMQLNDMATWNITSISLDGTNGFEYTYSYKNQKLYVMIPTPSTITSAQEKIKAVFEGEKLNSSYIESNNTNDVTEKKTINDNKVSGEQVTLENNETNKEQTTIENVTNNQQINIEKVENNKIIEPNNGTTSNIENNIQNDTILNEETNTIQNETISNEEKVENNKICTMVDGMCIEEYEEIIN